MRSPEQLSIPHNSDFGFRISVFGFFILLVTLVASQIHASPAATNSLLFSFFRDNGQAGLYLATSEDGLKWSELKPPGKSFLTPTVGGKLMRDPCLALGPDGTFHMVWTTTWGKPPEIGIAHSKDLIHWSEEQAIPVMAQETNTENSWAPELFYDRAKDQWIIFWASTITGRFPETSASGENNHRIYCTTTRDFKNYTPTRLFYDGGFNAIDATMLAAQGKFYLVVKDETKNPVKKDLHLAAGNSPEGPFGKAGPPIAGPWVEGPSALQIGGEYYIYFDHYTHPQYYGAVKSSDLEHWQDISPEVSFPPGARHGTVLKVPNSVVRSLKEIVPQ